MMGSKPISEVFNEDCLIGMSRYPDKFFDLAVVDPPYGIGKNWKKDTASKFYNHVSSYHNNNVPEAEYFNELFRVSANQIIWGANYYWNYLRPTSNIIWWDKMIEPQKHLRSAGELAWTSITRWPANIFKFSWNGCATSEKRNGFHPHEKPVALYRWLLKNYAKPGDKILDTHLGSQSSRIAAYKLGFDFWGWEIDRDYFKEGCERFEKAIAEPLFDAPKQLMQPKIF